jgi:RecA/RadA recombinase
VAKKKTLKKAAAKTSKKKKAKKKVCPECGGEKTGRTYDHAETCSKFKGKKEAPKTVVRMEMSELAKKYQATYGDNFLVGSEDFDVFSMNRIYTSIFEVDFVMKLAFGKRICISGDESVGKTVLCHIIAGAAQRTCRHCFLPIINWTNEETGEIKAACKCGKCQPMVVLHLDVEDSFDPPWARRWGVRVEDKKIKRQGFEIMKSKDESFWVCLPSDGNFAFDFAVDAIKCNAVDVVIFDSLAMLMPRESTETGTGEGRISPLARLASDGLRRIVNAQIIARQSFNARATTIWTNQFYQGPTKNPRQNPNRLSAGLKAKYTADYEMRITSARYDMDARKSRVGHDRSARYVDVTFQGRKSKGGGPPLGEGQFRLYLDTTKTRHDFMHAGQTDDYDRLFAYLHDLGHYKQEKGSHVLMGRKFSRVSDMKQFLMRDDIAYLSRYLIFREMLQTSAKDHLRLEHYNYSPWGLDPYVEQIEEADSTSVDESESGPEGGDPGEGEGPDWGNIGQES